MGKISKILLDIACLHTVRCSSTMALSPFIGNKSYESALIALNGLQSNAATLEKAKLVRQEEKLPAMLLCLQRVGLKIEDIDKLNIIHVAGTKGKGSTCAFSESILRAHGFKTGFFSSPHIVEVRERMRINGKPLSKDLFAEYFWECYLPLNHSKEAYDGLMPAYFRFLTIMALHTFLQEKVDVAIIEVGIGGQYDCTNIIRSPVVCGVTSLGMDHTSVLGNTIEEIAWNKAGIFKRGVPAITVPQKEEAMAILKRRAHEIGAPLYLAPALDTSTCKLGIPGAMQSHNASLAVELCSFWLINKSKELNQRLTEYGTLLSVVKELPIMCNERKLDNNALKGLSLTKWPGRCQKLSHNGLTFYLDGAHTEESIDVCVKWFQNEYKTSRKDSLKILWFNSTGDRQPEALLKGLMICNFDLAIFTPNLQSCASIQSDSGQSFVPKRALGSDLFLKKTSTDSQLKRCMLNRAAWLKLNENHFAEHDPTKSNGIKKPYVKYMNGQDQPTLSFPSISDALQWLDKNKSYDMHILCTGSLHLIGGILSYIDPDICDK